EHASAVVPNNVGVAVMVEVARGDHMPGEVPVGEPVEGVEHDAEVVRRQSGGAGSGGIDLMRARRRAIGDPQRLVTARIEPIEQHSVIKELHVSWRYAKLVRAGDADLVRTRHGAVGDPKAELAARVLAFKQRIGAKGRDVMWIETVDISAAHSEL